MYYVSAVLADKVTIKSVGDDQASTLPEGIPAPGPTAPVTSVPFQGQGELVALLTSLRDHGVALLGGPSGWPPGAVFERLRDLGQVTGPYTEIVFRGPGKWESRSS